MEFNFIGKSVTVLGQVYTIEVKKSKEDPCFKHHPGAYGCASGILKKIVLRDITERDDWKDAEEELIIGRVKQTLRHEIVHAFLDESGLCDNARNSSISSWSKNEEMVDWIAIQGPKIAKAWEEAGAV